MQQQFDPTRVENQKERNGNCVIENQLFPLCRLICGFNIYTFSVVISAILELVPLFRVKFFNFWIDS